MAKLAELCGRLLANPWRLIKEDGEIELSDSIETFVNSVEGEFIAHQRRCNPDAYEISVKPGEIKRKYITKDTNDFLLDIALARFRGLNVKIEIERGKKLRIELCDGINV
jgi:hypothetical protein